MIIFVHFYFPGSVHCYIIIYNRHFWCREFYVDTVGRNQKVIEEYIRNQEHEDIIADQISFKEYNGHFKGSK